MAYDPDGLFIFEDPEEEGEKKDQPLTPLVAAPGPKKHSRIDELIDTVAGVKPKSAIRACKDCGGTSFMVLSPIEGGTRTRKCRKCRRVEPIATVVTSAPIQLPSGQIPMGPYYGPRPRMPERGGPLFRVRSTPQDDENGR